MKLDKRGQVAQPRTDNHSLAGGAETANTGQIQRVPEASRLDTLAHLGTFPDSSLSGAIRSQAEVSQEGESRYSKRAKRKHITKPLVTALTEYAKQNESFLEKSYRNSIYCSDRVIQEDGTLRSHYCKNRCCLVCEAIKTARYINQYGPEIESWKSPHFVTQTLRTVPITELRDRLSYMQDEWRATYKAARKLGIEVKAVRKLEITFNTRTKLYHPHYHFITSDHIFGEYLVDRHLGRNRQTASSQAQDIRKADRRSLVELFKYATKPVSSKGSGHKQSVPLYALDGIYQNLYRKNVISKVGFKLNLSMNVEELEGLKGGQAFKSVERDIMWQWIQHCSDWIDLSTGETLSGYIPDPE